METLNKMEQIEVDKKDQPIEDIIITAIEVFVDPFKEADEQLAQDRADEKEKVQQQIIEEQKKKQRRQEQPLKVYRSGVGKYLNLEALKKSIVSSSSSSSISREDSGITRAASTSSNKKLKARSELNDFSKW